MIEVRQLAKNYGQTRALDGVTFTVQRGEIVGFLGPNGAGKSTTMKILTCFIMPDGGGASVAGHDVLKEPLEVRRAIGYLPENTPLYEEMGVVEFLSFVAGIRRLSPAKRRERIDYVIRMCGVSPVTGKMIGQLSRGFRQRVGLAQALLHDPDILILDEPTSALDPSQIVEIRDLIREIGKTKTILLSTHIMQEVTATCDRAIIIAKGRIVASGSPAELTGRGSSGRVIRAQARCAPEALAAAVKELSGVSEATAQRSDDNPEISIVTATFSNGTANAAEAIFTLARDRGWVLRELREERATLEQVFIEVTRGT